MTVYVLVTKTRHWDEIVEVYPRREEAESEILRWFNDDVVDDEQDQTDDVDVAIERASDYGHSVEIHECSFSPAEIEVTPCP